MNIIKVITLMLLLVSPLVLGGNISSADLTALIKKAHTTRLKAAKAGFEWTTTAGLIKQAKAAAKKGNTEKAQKLANKALKQAENSLKQAKYAAEHWQDYEPK